MTNTPPRLTISTSPFVLEGASTPDLMGKVIYALLPVLLAAAWFFGVAALLLVATACLGAMATEWFFATKRQGLGSLTDGSALLTGLLLGLTLPPGLPLWMAFLGGFIAIALGKLIWGGLGNNMFNPALLGRAFLQAAFPEAMTKLWLVPRFGPEQSFFDFTGFFHVPDSLLAMPLMRASADGFSGATPLGLAKFDGQITEISRVFLGNISGSLGETSALLLLVCGAWLAWKRVLNWRGPLATLLSVLVFGSLLHLIAPESCPPPGFMLLSGGLLFGAVFMVTDPVTTPITSTGLWIFGFGLGLLVVVIRVYGGLQECVMFAILFMNGLTPLINRITQPRQFGG